MSRRRSYANDEAGAAAVEFAMVVPVAMLLLLVVFHLCFVTYATSSLHWAVEQAARCAGVGQQNTGVACSTSTTTGPTKTDVQNYAAAIYKGPLVNPQFVASEGGTASAGYCRQVSGSGTYRIILGFVNVDIPVSAKACFPETSAWT